jgi:RHS repeat-associated protein
MKRIFYLAVALLPVLVSGQSTDQNYVKTKAYKTATTTSIGTPSAAQATQSITYFDGLGRPIQQVAHKQAGNGNDLVTHIEYDAFGRQTKEYLPVVNGQTLNYHSLDANSILSYYASPPSTVEVTTNPYSEKLLEASPLNRILEQAAPGNDWAITNPQKHTIRFDYQTNVANEIKLFKATATWDATKGLYDIALTQNGTTFYGANQLYKTVTKDENWVSGNNHTTEEFKDKEGRVVLKRTYGTSMIEGVETAAWHETYYVYDQFGNLTYVIPPLADGSITSTELDGLCYQYKYDHRNRLVEKKLPGKQWEFIVYDKLDRVVMSGPTLSPFTSPTGNGWMITKYDVYNRPVLTAWLPGTTTTESRKTHQDGYNGTTAINEAKMVNPATVNGVAFHYSNVVAPTAGYHVLTINYYDTYTTTGITFSPAISYSAIHGQTLHNTTLGNWPMELPTMSWVRVPETTSDYKHEKSYILYDQKGRVIRTFKNNYLGGYTQTDQKLQPITGRVDFTETRHKRLSGDAELYVKDTYTYTDQDRLLSHTHQIGTAGTPQLLAKNDYNELGQLISKQVGGTDVTTFVGLQKVDYSYNIRGWLKSINDVDNLTQSGNPTDLFAFKVNYNTIENESVYTGTKLYNGNISETYWRTYNDNVKRKYSYKYDELNRLKDALYQRPENSSPLRNSYNESLTYDKNGNIKNLSRKGEYDDVSYALEIDDLRYHYHSINKNQLTTVVDDSTNPSGFKDGPTNGIDDYSYDDYGNMTEDNNKGITNISYNHLNLPLKITFGGNKDIQYLYNATGQKIRKTVTDGSVATITEYLDGYQYSKEGSNAIALTFFPHAEGYVKRTGTHLIRYNYVFNYTDHLGNVRLSYSREGNVGAPTILEENNYYPFGLKHENYNVTKKQYDKYNGEPELVPCINCDYKYRYNGQEWQNELGLNMTAMDYRQYDNALGRFNGMDALAELMPSITPYHFGFNNPVYWGDPTGLKPQTAETIKMVWDNTAEGKNSYWVNDGFGNFDNADGSGFVNNSGEYFQYSESLPGVTIISQRGYRKDESFIGQLQSHVYSKGKYYQGFRDRAFSKQVDELQSGLDWLGTADPTGIIDGINALTYLARGQKANAAIAAVAILPFGDVGKFAKIQKHHVIPKAVYKEFKSDLAGIIKRDGKANLMDLPVPYHLGGHNAYNDFVTNALNRIKGDIGITPGSIDALQGQLRGMINEGLENFNKTGENLNTYFKQF